MTNLQTRWLLGRWLLGLPVAGQWAWEPESAGMNAAWGCPVGLGTRLKVFGLLKMVWVTEKMVGLLKHGLGYWTMFGLLKK